MYNSDLPTRAELPSSAQLLRSTLTAAFAATALLVTVVLPAEYGLDPTGVGRALGLKQMGDIKMQLQEQAEADAASGTNNPGPRENSLGSREAVLQKAPVEARQAPSQNTSAEAKQDIPSKLAAEAGQTPPLKPSSRESQNAALEAIPPAPATPAKRRDETKFTLQPGEGAEVKASLAKGQTIAYTWTTDGGKINHDTHGEPYAEPNATTSYKKGRGVERDEGTLEAPFDGSHGWFWRNRTDKPVTVTLKTSGYYGEMKRVK
jgi:hypothetical protein